MTVHTQASAHHGMRPLLILAAAAALVFSFALSAGSARAGEDNIATLHQDSVDSSVTEDKCAEGDNPAPGEVLWHFLLNDVDPGIESALTIHATFTGAGELTDDSEWVANGAVHHFYITTIGDDVLTDAWVNIGESTYNQLNLSHICHGAEATPTPTPEGSEAGGTGTPAPSVPDTATSLPGMAGPLATVVFGLILLGSLGALAYANVSAVRRRS